MPQDVGDKRSVLFQGLDGFWQRFFKDAPDLEAYYQASEVYLGQVYLDLLASTLNVGIVDTPIFNKEYWKLFSILETETQFVEGNTSEFNRFLYDMPGDIVSIDGMQNTIFAPTITVERDVDFDIQNDDGFIRFYNDPFRLGQDDDGIWTPLPGISWRSVTRKVGNSLRDRYSDYHASYDPYTLGVQRGDTLRILAQAKEGVVAEGLLGQVVTSGPEYVFQAVGVGVIKVGDTISVYGHGGLPGSPDDVFKNFYIVKEVNGPNTVTLETSTVGFPFAASTQPLYWRAYHVLYFEVTPEVPFRDYEVDYIRDGLCVGSVNNPYPLDLNGPIVYAIVRDVPTPQVVGAELAIPAVEEDLNSDDIPDIVGPLPNPEPTNLGVRHLIPGSVKIYARVTDTTMGDERDVIEGVDYTVDYARGIIYQVTYWIVPEDDLGVPYARCDFQYRKEVLLSAGGVVQEKPAGSIRQLSYWVPEVWVDRFTLYYNYGTLLNRFAASSEEYKAFLRGVMYLYMSGPILERIEAALNLAAAYPVVRTDGEILQGYGSGLDASGSTGVLNASADTLTVDTGDHVFSIIDEGGYIVFPNPLNDKNNGAFRIISVDTATNSVLLESSYGFISEDPIDWELSRRLTKTVTTNLHTYEFPYSVPVRTDIQDVSNFGVLSFAAFEALTEAFRVTDYIEDPNWWYGKYVPQVLWDEPDRARRLISTLLYENVIASGAEPLSSDPLIGDPGFYIGADSDGNIVEPTSVVYRDAFNNPVYPPVVTNTKVSTYRNSAAFVIFDRYLKYQMYYIEFARGLELSDQFKDDLEELVLVAKPSYTYPYVEPGEIFIDNVVLTDLLNIGNIGFEFGGDTDDGSDALHLAPNELVIGDTNFPWNIGDMFRYTTTTALAVPGAPDPVVTGYSFVVPSMPTDSGLITLNINATVGGEPVLEGRDYTVNWLSDSVNAWEVTALTDWDSGSLTVSYQAAERLNGSYDTRDGWTPLIVGGLNPWYVRAAALDPDSPTYADEWNALRTEYVDRPLQLTVDESGGSYTYP